MKSLLATILLLFINPASANIVGSDLQNFNPTSDGLGFVTVSPSWTLEPGILNVGFFLNYATNTLPYFNDPSLNPNPAQNQKFTEPNDGLVASDLHLGLGIFDWLDVGANAAFVLSQDIDLPGSLGTYENTGLNDLRLNGKARFYKTKDSGAALLASIDFERTNNNPFSGTDPKPSFNIEVAWDKKLSRDWHWAVNAGYRVRGGGTAIASTLVTPIPDQITYSTGLNYDLRKWDSHVIFELFGSTPLKDVSLPVDRKVSNLQGLVGWRWDVYDRLDVHGGLGTEVYHGLATPDILAYAGFNWRLGHFWKKAMDSDKDGVDDSDDRCPRTLRRNRNRVNSDGCVDSDRDGVYDSKDQCPRTPRKYRNSVNERGCHDADGDGVFDDIDKCPRTPFEYKEAVDEAGCHGDIVLNDDLDGDGVVNIDDECPNTLSGTPVNDLGCDLKRVKDITLKNVNFYTGTAKMTKDSRKRMNATIKELIEHQDTIEKVIVEGHTDSVGKKAMNQKLSQNRAGTIRRLLIDEVAFRNEQVKAVGHGEEKPVDRNDTKAGRLNNRRVELRLIRSKEE